MRGVHIEELLARFSGKSNGGWNPRKHNCFIYTFILGSQVLHSTGYALAQKLENNADSRVTVVFFGDGASSQGAVHEGMVFAASYKTKQLFIIQDNGWAISTPTSRQSRVPLLHRAYGYGMGGLEVDGNSFIEVFSATKLLCERIRRGEGPQVLVLKTLRVDPHATSDAPQKYRNQHDYQQVFETIDPINKLKNQLITRGSDPAYLETLRDKARIHIKTLIDQSSKTCKGTW